MADGSSSAPSDTADVPTRRARHYADVNVEAPADRFDIAGFALTYGKFRDYTMGRKIGEGAYSEVFDSVHTVSGTRVVLKRMREEKTDRMKLKRELKLLLLLQGHPNIVKVYEVLKDPSTGIKHIVFEHLENPDFRLSFYNFRDLDARLYLFKLLSAVDHAHSLGILHRDIKPRNVLYDPRTRQLRLTDWGFAEFYFPGKPIEKWPGTRYYKAPELYFRYPYYDYGADMWSFGCIVAALVFARMPMFKGREDSLSQLVEITRCLGTEGLHRYLCKYRIPIRSKYRQGIKKRKRQPWNKFVNPRHADMCTPEGIDLVDKLLVWDHEKRWSSKEALAHPFFDPVRAGDEAVPMRDMSNMEPMEALVNDSYSGDED
eukprot:c9504_g1_i2.p1 GENE.c9504_g1_i2~~c9504_g1_i2.p1  ORF type:complete len:409 (+),score=69.18 c9504_g1_i2:110-1228(+)